MRPGTLARSSHAARRSFCALTLLAVALMLLCPVPFRTEGRLFSAVENLAHFPLFFALTWALEELLPARWRGGWHRWPAALVVLLAGLFEAGQWFTGRDPGLADASMAIAGGWAAIAWRIRCETIRRSAALLAYGFALVLAVAALTPATRVLVDRAQARLAFPLLSSFETRLEIGRWWSHGVRLSRVTQQATEGRHALRIAVGRSRVTYPGIFLSDLPRDWGGYREICFDIFLAAGAPRTLWVRADDRADYPPYDDRAQTAIVLTPGPNRVALDMTTFLRTPHGRPLEFERIRRFGIFLDQHDGSETLFLDHVRLRR